MENRQAKLAEEKKHLLSSRMSSFTRMGLLKCLGFFPPQHQAQCSHSFSFRTWWTRMEQAAKHVIAEDDIPLACKKAMDSFPHAALELAVTSASVTSLMTLIASGEVHVVDALVQSKLLYDKLQEQPNAVVTADNNVQFLQREVVKTTDFLDKFLLAAIDKHLEVIENMMLRDELVAEKGLSGPRHFASLWKLLKTWKVLQGRGPGPGTVSFNNVKL